MKIFADTANLRDIKEALKRGFIRGITTNPSLLAKEPRGSYAGHIKEIINLIRLSNLENVHLSVEVFSRDPEEIFKQAEEFLGWGYEHISVKVQIGWDELEVIRELSRRKISVNCTCCMSVNQAVMAAAAGAKYVSLFWGRIRDVLTNDCFNFKRFKVATEKCVLDWDDSDPAKVVGSTRKILDNSYPDAEIIVGSIRRATDIRDAALAGAHIVTVPPKFFPEMINHFKTDEVVNQFLSDFKNWMS
jgi:transaldolase